MSEEFLRKNQSWSASEDILLRELRKKGMEYKKIASIIGRTVYSCTRRMNTTKLRRHKSVNKPVERIYIKTRSTG